MSEQGWLALQLEKNADEVRNWPEWMRKAANKATSSKLVGKDKKSISCPPSKEHKKE